ncbi:MAG: sulfur carrier protein ThiS [Pseudomonadota bacterium]
MSTQAPADPFTVTLNGEPRAVCAGCTLEMLLQQQGLAPQQVATALNGEFVPRALRTTRLLGPGDAVTCFQPIVGG